MSCILHKDFGLLKKVPVNAVNDASIHSSGCCFCVEIFCYYAEYMMCIIL